MFKKQPANLPDDVQTIINKAAQLEQGDTTRDSVLSAATDVWMWQNKPGRLQKLLRRLRKKARKLAY